MRYIYIDYESRQNLQNNEYMMSTEKRLELDLQRRCDFYKKQGVCVLGTAEFMNFHFVGWISIISTYFTKDFNLKLKKTFF